MKIRPFTSAAHGFARNVRSGAPALPLALALAAGLMPAAAPAQAQLSAPVFVDDSAGAADALARAGDFVGSGSIDEAARVLQALLDTEGDRVVASADDPELYLSVRRHAHDLLLAHPRLMDRYRQIQGPAAERLLALGDAEAVETASLFTPAGFEAALRVAQRQIESSAFFAAWRTLEQLERHPDRLGAAGADAARLLALAARCLDRPALREVADRWMREAGLDYAPGERVPFERPALNIGLTPLSPGPATVLADMVARPLWSEPLSARPADPDALAREFGRIEDESAKTRLLHILPTVAGDAIYINDADSVASWDRFTLSQRWRASFAPSNAGRLQTAARAGQNRIEDLNTVSVFGPWAVATTGVATQSSRVGDARVHALDARTGERRWSAEVSTLDPGLEQASVRGPAMIDQGVVSLLTTKRNKERRIDSVHLVGLDLATGALRWRRHLASTGALPYAGVPRIAEPAIVEGGVIYVANRLGVAAAVESATGRVRWVRRVMSESAAGAPGSTWEVASPQLINGVLYFISPDQTLVMALDAATGAVVDGRPAADFGRPRYLLSCAGHLVAVSENRVLALDAARFGDASETPRTIAVTDGFLGRVAIAGEEALAPVDRGVLAADVHAENPGAARLLSLDEPGNLLAVESQLVVVNDAQVHTYLIWGVAERMLIERMELDPTDATPAATYAELAYRAGKPDRILPAVDRALRAIEAAPLNIRNQEARRRLFEAVLAMVDPDPRAPIVAGAASKDAGALLERLARLATSPEDRVRQLIASANHAEAGAQVAHAVESYQRILDDPSLGSASIVRHGASFDAESEAARRLRRLLREFGPDIYAKYDAEAHRALAAAAGALDPERFAAIARRYPVSRSAAQAWLDAAGAYVTRGRPQGAVYALERGIAAAEDTHAPDDPLVGELAGRLVQALARSGRVAAASAALARVLERAPGVSLTEGGSPIDTGALSQALAARMAELERRPVIGLLGASPATQLLMGWAIAEPLIDEPSVAAAEFIAMTNHNANEFALYGVDGAGGVRRVWTVPNEMATLIRIDDAVYLGRMSEQGVVIEKLDLASGRTIWKAPAFRSLFPADAAPERRPGDGVRPIFIETPLGARREADEALLAMDGRTLALVERTGRAAGVDLDTGRVLWSQQLSTPAVFDITASAGTLVIGGADLVPQAAGRAGVAIPGVAEPSPVLLALDIRTGRVQHKLPAERGAIRWVRMTPEGALLVGSREGISAFDLFHGRMKWTTTERQSRDSVEAWPFAGRTIVLGIAGMLNQIENETGVVRPAMLESGGPLGTFAVGIRARQLGELAAITSPQGLMVYDRSGELVGMDHRTAETQLLPARFARDFIIALDRSPIIQREDRALFDLRIFTNSSCALAQRAPVPLGDTPTTVGLIDGRILITAGEATIAIDAPEHASEAAGPTSLVPAAPAP